MWCVCVDLLIFVWFFSVLADVLLHCEVVCRCGVENSDLTRCDGPMRLMCGVVGLVLLV